MSDDKKVTSLADAAKRKAEKNDDNQVPEDSFAELKRKNEENKKRLEAERKKANKGVIRSYRLKQ